MARKDFPPYGQPLHQIEIEIVTETGLVAYGDCSVRAHLDRRHDDVLLPIALAGRNIAGQDEVRQRREGDVMGPANAAFQHAPAPDWDTVRLAEVVNAFCLCEAPDPAEFHIDDSSSFQADGLLRVVRGPDALVQADGGIEQGL